MEAPIVLLSGHSGEVYLAPQKCFWVFRDGPHIQTHHALSQFGYFYEKKLIPNLFGNGIFDCQNEFYTWSH